MKQGHRDPPVDGRKERQGRERPAATRAAAFFQWVYDNLVEPLAEVKSLPETVC